MATCKNDGIINHHLTFYVNHKRIIERNAEPHWTLVFYLRKKLALTGTKVGCGTGGCGSCTVVVSKYNRFTKSIVHFSINSCLTLLCTLDGCHILTIEGLGSTHTPKGNLHPIQRSIAENYGSQCGFCTPGMCMSLYDTLVNCSIKEHPTVKDIEETFNGNLCRCTGYRPILQGSKQSFAEKQVTDSMILDIPSELGETYSVSLLQIKGTKVKFYRPITLNQLYDIQKKYQNETSLHLFAGNTGEDFDDIVHHQRYPILVHLSEISELHVFNETVDGLLVGACVTITNLKSYFARNQLTQQVYQMLSEQLEYNASRQIQNQATIGGHILNHSRKHTSDILPILYVSQTKLRFLHLLSRNELEINIKDLSTTNRENFLLVSILIPFINADEYLQSYKQAHRRKHDTGIITCAFRLKLDSNNRIVTYFDMAIGGLHAGMIFVPKTTIELLLTRLSEWTKDEVMRNTRKKLIEEIESRQLPNKSQYEYRHTLISSFLLKFYLHVTQNSQRLFSKLRPISYAEQNFHISQDSEYVHQPHLHHNAYIHATGEAKYVDDLPSPINTLYGALVLSTKPHAQILSVDIDKAQQVPGFIKFYSHRDVPPTGINQCGEPCQDEEVFASKFVHYVAMVIGLCVADTEEHARYAASLVLVEYEELSPVILSIDEAIEHKSFIGSFGEQEKVLQAGDLNRGFRESDDILEGNFYIGGQEHFYMEPNAFLAQPISEGHDTQLHIYSTTQGASQLQKAIAKVLGLNANEVICHVIRVGGGFGGKESRNVIPCVAIALAAYDLQLPVRLCLTREEDMKLTGHRHPFKVTYKVGFLKNGKLKSLDIYLYANNGHSTDCSSSMLERAMLHCDNIYKCENICVRGRICRTNLPTNTAMRGFGAPQGLLTAELIMDQINDHLRLNDDPSLIRQLNFYQPNEKTFYNQSIEKKDWYVEEMWKKLKEIAKYDERLEEVQKFNTDNIYRKRGISILGTKYGIGATSTLFFHQASALVHIYQDGSVLITHGGIELGQGLQVKMLQITAQELGIDLALVRFNETSTDKVPNATATVASLSSDLYGPALINACQILNRNLESLKHKHPNFSWKELIEQAYNDRIQLSAHGFYSVPDKYLKNNFQKSDVNYMYFTQGVGLSEVEIDCLTGDFHIVRTDILMDLGKSLNPRIDIGQIEGAFMQGVGYLTIEELIQGDHQHPWISQLGSLDNADPNKYKIPMANDIPIDFRITLLNEHESNKHAVCYSSKAVGEPPLFLSATVFFAIKHAIAAYRQCEEPFQLNIPATSERIRMACKDFLVTEIIQQNGGYEFQPKGSF